MQLSWPVGKHALVKTHDSLKSQGWCAVIMLTSDGNQTTGSTLRQGRPESGGNRKGRLFLSGMNSHYHACQEISPHILPVEFSLTQTLWEKTFDIV